MARRVVVAMVVFMVMAVILPVIMTVHMFVRANMGMCSAGGLRSYLASGGMRVRSMFMAVVPQLGFVEQKEKHQPDEQGHKQIMRAGLAFKGFGQ
jgi:predicted metal-binding membrane protein